MDIQRVKIKIKNLIFMIIDKFFIFIDYYRKSSYFIIYYFGFILIFENFIIKKSEMVYQYDISIYCIL